MNSLKNASWKSLLKEEFNKDYFKELTSFVKEEYAKSTCYPENNLLFEAFNQLPVDQVKVVIIGQDPYHNPNQAHGLCFSVNEGVKVPPSLANIFKEIHEDLEKPIPNSGNLTYWTKQGVLLLNATLSVRANEPGSHQKMGWERFTGEVIRSISTHREGIVFLLWGGYAKKKSSLIDAEKHTILTSGHPSPLSANRGHWFGNKHFSKTNDKLKELGKTPIDW